MPSLFLDILFLLLQAFFSPRGLFPFSPASSSFRPGSFAIPASIVPSAILASSSLVPSS